MARPDLKRRNASVLRHIRSPQVKRIGLILFALACVTGAIFSMSAGCSGWDPTSPFERNSPEVDQAIIEIEAGNYQSAEEALEHYLGTGPCSDAGIGLPESVRQKHNGSFDLGLTLFYLAEQYGQRFGDEELADSGPAETQLADQRNIEVDCALVIVKAIAADPNVPADLRARARYLAGNLEFLRRNYEEAVKYYDQALSILPGIPEDAEGDSIGRDAAWNRAIALRRIQDQKDAGPDAEPDAEPDAPPDAPPDSEDGSDGEDGNDGGEDAGNDGGEDGGGDDAGADGGAQDASPQDQDAASPEPQPQPQPEPQPQPQDALQDDRILDQLEEAPTYQEQEAKARAGARRGRAMEDK